MAKHKRTNDPRPSAESPAAIPTTFVANNPWLLTLALVLITFAAYRPVWQAGFIWDDDAHVAKNANLHSLAGLYRIWAEPQASQQYYPLSLTTHWIEYQLWRLKPLGYHLVNVLLHALNAVLLWLVLRQLKIPGAWFAAAIFAVHPIEVESVAWVSERKNVLSVFFYFLALLAYFRFRLLDSAGPTNGRLYPVVLFLCAVLSKTVACTLPAVLVVLLWWKKGRVERRDVWLLTPLFVLGVVFGLGTAWLEKYHAGAKGADWSLSFLQRCLLAGRALWFYTGKLFWPDHLTFIYPRWTVSAGIWWQYLFPLAALAVGIGLWLLRGRMGKGPFVAMLIFAGTLFPALGFFDVYPFRFSFVADHFQYLAGAGLIALVASMGAKLCARTGRAGRAVTAVGVPAILLVLGTLTTKQAKAYRDSETLWYNTLDKNPTCWLAHVGLANTFVQAGRFQDAIRHDEQAVRIKPDCTEADNNWAYASLRLGKTPEAIQHCEQALRVRPDDAFLHNNLGNALLQAGRVQEAIRHYERALQINRDYANAENNLGNALMEAHRVADAIYHYQRALRIDPDYAEVRSNLAEAQATLTNETNRAR